MAFIPFSIALWVNPVASGVRNDMVAPTSAGGVGFHINTSNKLLFSREGVSDFGTSTASISNSAWTHAGLTWDGSNFQFFVNGAFDSTAASGSSVTTGQGPYLLGRSIADAKVFNGSLADVMYYQGVMSRPQFLALGTGVLRPHQLGLGRALKFFTPLDSYDAVVRDLSALQNTGKVVGTSTALVTGPKFLSPLKIVPPQNVRVTPIPPVVSAVFRRTRSELGTRVGSRQMAG